MTKIVPFPESAQNETLSEEGQEAVQEQQINLPTTAQQVGEKKTDSTAKKVR
jgi:hypothetical protein